MQFTNDPNALRIDPDMAADLQGLRALLLRMSKEGMFRGDLRADRERGVQHHFSVLLPCLTASARRELESADLRASGRLAAEDSA